MQIAVFGCGYVGLATGVCLAELGNHVIGVDIDADRIHQLQKGQCPLYEPGLSEMMEQNIAGGRLRFTTDAEEAITQSPIVLCCVGTPHTDDPQVQLSGVFSVAELFARYAQDGALLVIKSTVAPGTTRKCAEYVENIINEQKKYTKKVFIACSPEFLREGAAVKDTLNPERIIIGVENPEAEELLRQLYRPLLRTGRPLMVTDPTSAEVIKHAANAFLATKISFINEMAGLCTPLGADITQVAKGLGLDSRIGSRFLHAGIGYGGSCFSKDIATLRRIGQQLGQDFPLLQVVEAVNERQKQFIVRTLEDAFDPLRGKVIALWGLSFKPRTDDVRDAPSLKVIEALLQHECTLRVFDPVAQDAMRTHFGDKLVYTKTPEEAATDADGVALLTEWDIFRGQNLGEIARTMRGNVFVDGRNVYDPSDAKAAGLHYISVGRA